MRTEDVVTVKLLSTGYVRVDAGHRQFAQLPKDVWDTMEPGQVIDDKWAFEPEWCRLRKPAPDGEGRKIRLDTEKLGMIESRE